MTANDCVLVTKVIYTMLDHLGFDAPEKIIVALYLEEAAKAECREIEELEGMAKSG